MSEGEKKTIARAFEFLYRRYHSYQNLEVSDFRMIWPDDEKQEKIFEPAECAAG